MFEHVADPAIRKALRSKNPTEAESALLIPVMEDALDADSENPDVDFAVWQLRHAALSNAVVASESAKWKEAHEFAQEFYNV